MLTSTVIIMAHDPIRKPWLDECLESVEKQTRQADAIYLISDYETGYAPRNNLVQIPFSSKVGSKINFGIYHAWTDACLLLCDDDLLDLTYLEKTMSAMEEYKADIVYTDMELFGMEHYFVQSEDWKDVNKGGAFPITSLFRKWVWKQHHFLERVSYADWEFWWSAYENGFFAYHILEPLFKYRTHLNQDSRQVNVEKCTEEVRRLHANS